MKEFDYRSQVGERSAEPGSTPGVLQAPEGSPPSRVDVLTAGQAGVGIQQALRPEQVPALRAEHDGFIWVDVNGLGTPETIMTLGNIFGFHRLSLEDVLHLHQRPKVESYPDHVYVVVQVPYQEADGTLAFEQVSLFAGEGFLVSFQSSEQPRLAPLVRRFEQGKRLRSSGVDYVLYAALDVLTDAGFPVLEAMDQRVEELESGLLDGSSKDDLIILQRLRSELTTLRRVLWNLREIPSFFLRADSELVREDSRPYFRDVQDHAVRLVERAEQLRESCTGLFELHLSVSGEKLNEVMKLLTVISTVFIPMTFVAGIYGMNFEYMPELGWRWSYPLVWLLMLGTTIGMLRLFFRRGWLGSASRTAKTPPPPLTPTS